MHFVINVRMYCINIVKVLFLSKLTVTEGPRYTVHCSSVNRCSTRIGKLLACLRPTESECVLDSLDCIHSLE